MAFPNSFNSSITGFATGQFVIPPAVYSWAVYPQAGTVFLNGFPLVAGQAPVKGGRYGGFKLNGGTTLVVGCTGGQALVTYDT